MSDVLKNMLKPLASLRLTVALLAMSMVLIFAATWAQVDQGIWKVVQDYFRKTYVWIELQNFLPGGWQVSAGIPWPGGVLIGILLVINLLAAHSVRFSLTWKRSGILMIHAAVLLFLVGEAVTGWLADESQMPIYVGETIEWSQDIREVELAVVDHSHPEHDRVVVVAGDALRKASRSGEPIRNAKLPFQIRVDRYLENSQLFERSADSKPAPPGARGFALLRDARQVPRATGVDGGTVDFPAAWVTLQDSDRKLGTYLVSPGFQPEGLVYKLLSQDVVAGDKTYALTLRFRRQYHPFKIHLSHFTHDQYTGTTTPKDFASDIRLVDPDRAEDRTVKIYMNHPLRYQGQTFYQSGYIPPARGTVLQVVANPGWQIPYLAFTLMAVGLFVHFGMALFRFLSKNVAVSGAMVAPDANDGGVLARITPWAAAVLCLVYLILAAKPPRSADPYRLSSFARLPVSYQGRVKPLDTVARNTLTILSGRQTLEHEGRKLTAAQWLIDVICKRDVAFKYRIFRVDHPEVLGLFGWKQETRKRFSYEALERHMEALFREARRADKIDKRYRTSFDAKALQLANHIALFENLATHRSLHVVPPIDESHDWMTLPAAAGHAHDAGELPASVQAYHGMLTAYRDRDAAAFNIALARYSTQLEVDQPQARTRAGFETFFNMYGPFGHARVLYVLAAVLVFFSWLGWSGPLTATAYRVLVITAVLHSLGLGARIYLSGRPPVTNLYASAVFIGWGSVITCLILERIYRNGIGTLLASVSGFLTLLVAWSLAGAGDTMAVLVAVLDTNFWLATHVVVVTLGYAATFLAGLIGIVYILRGLLTTTLTQQMAKRIAQMLYGTICFALLFSLVGTVLGGIWADQSWGRFWGWDPKENGALLIVLWNALILHSRWGGLARARGVAVLSIFGNIVTSWSWFGTNMLGVGLHSYGFIASAVFWLLLFIFSQIVLMALGLVPLRHWRSFARPAESPLSSAAGTAAVSTMT